MNVSISKILKIAIALAGAGVASGTIAVPAIGAVTLFALSKHASKKEKQAVLDQIDVELQVLDREISRAESSGSAKKYRQLLMIQKIYNVSVNKFISELQKVEREFLLVLLQV